MTTQLSLANVQVTQGKAWGSSFKSRSNNTINYIKTKWINSEETREKIFDKVKLVTKIALVALAFLSSLYLNPTITTIGFAVGFIFSKGALEKIKKINDAFKAASWIPAVVGVAAILWVPLGLSFGSAFTGAYVGAHFGEWVEKKRKGHNKNREEEVGVSA